MKLRSKIISTIFAISLLNLSACTNNPYTGERGVSKAAIYGGGGAAAGALTGYLAGGNTKSTLIGLGAGGAVGGGYGYYRDVQEKKLREVLMNSGVQIQKVGENDLRLIMPGNISFSSNNSDLKSSFYKTLNSIALVLKKYDKTNVTVSGYTDSTGSKSINNTLSNQRADSVSDYLSSQGIAANRLKSFGYGSSNPIASNANKSGRAANRRVEINLSPRN
ncbi:MAG: outer membrane protein OmpA-like peptidoglycan-associated protein [Rickettsiales bacterium]|jgi:outer membrane protein OmpA-like peptidoglycan-associated protein